MVVKLFFARRDLLLFLLFPPSTKITTNKLYVDLETVEYVDVPLLNSVRVGREMIIRLCDLIPE